MVLVRLVKWVRPPQRSRVFVRTTQDRVVAAAASVDLVLWQALLGEAFARIGCRFRRVEPRRRAQRFVLGLLAGLPRTNCWTIAEHVGDATPHGMQHLLSRAVWDADEVRDDVRDYALAHLADPEAVLVLDETGDEKKGDCSAGVQRQYSGTTGRIENCQVSVFLTYSARAGHTLIDRELYLPAGWAGDPARRARAGIPAEVEFATKSQLAGVMITRVLDAGAPAAWVTADEAYGKDGGLRTLLEAREQAYVLAVACDHRMPGPESKTRADEAAAALPKRAWQRLSAGAGAKGHRYYHWARIRLRTGQPGHHWLLIRRNLRTGDAAYYRCYAPRPVSLPALIRVAGRRWTIEETFQTGKELTGLDQHQVRTWTSWYRWTTLVMLAHAFLAVAAAHARTTLEKDLIPLTLNEIRHLYATLVIAPARTLTDTLGWSHWRRRHQHQAKNCHYQHRHHTPTP